MYYQRCDVRIQEPTARPVAPLVTGVPPNLLKESVGTLTDATLEWVARGRGPGAQSAPGDRQRGRASCLLTQKANLFFHLWVTLREGAGRAERARRPTAGLGAFKIS